MMMINRFAADAVPEDEFVYGLEGIAEFLGVHLCHVNAMIEKNLITVFPMPGLATRCARKSDLAAITDGCKAAAAAAADKKRKIIAKKLRDRYHSRKRGN